MAALETVGCTATIAAGPVFTAATALAGQSLSIRNCDIASKVYLQDVWAQNATIGQLRIRSPRLHDFVNGIDFQIPAGVSPSLLPGDMMDVVIPQDTLTVELNTTAAEVDLAFLNIYYTNLPGIDARLATWDQVKPRIVHYTTNRIAIAAGAAAAWSAGTAFSTGSWAPEPNTDYAVLGFESSVAEGAVAISGTDTGNLKVGGFGAIDPEFTRDFFRRNSVEDGMPEIPIVNSANNATLQAFTANVAGTASTVSFLLAQLQ